MESKVDCIRGGNVWMCGSVHVQSFNDNLKELGVVESKRGAIRKGLVHELLYAQDAVLCSYFAQRPDTKLFAVQQNVDANARTLVCLELPRTYSRLSSNWHGH